jgi:hypothetical protein
MELNGYFVGVEIEENYITLQLYIGENDYYYEDETNNCALIKIRTTPDPLNEFTLKFNNLSDEDHHINVKSDKSFLTISFWVEEEIQLPILEEPSISYNLDYKIINWKIKRIFDLLSSTINSNFILNRKIDELNEFLNNEYSNSQKKIIFFQSKSDIEKVFELNGKIEFIEKIMQIIQR